MSDLNERTWRELADQYGFEDSARPKIEGSFLFASRRLDLAIRDFQEALRRDPHIKQAFDQLKRFRLIL